ncbi:MAG: VWA domain-containing protein, partial [Leptolyngbya sp. PLA1]|nr:VWA domain-containing protein [Leptolyngbya sp. PLA1]
LRLDHPEWLWILLPAVLITAWGAAWFRAMTPTRRAAAVLVRLLLLATGVLALAGLSLTRPVTQMVCVLVLDRSGSVERYARSPEGQPATEAILRRVEAEVRERGPDDLLAGVVFDGRATGVSAPSGRVPKLGEAPPPGAPGTDIQAALAAASRLIPPSATGRIVLISDGVQTGGDARRAAAQSQYPIDVLPIEYAAASDVAIEAFDAPPVAAEEAAIAARLVLSSVGTARGTLRLYSEGRALASRALTLPPGETILKLDAKLPPGRVHRLLARWEPFIGENEPADAVPENNSARALTVSAGRGAALLADPRPGDPSELADALSAGGWDVRRLAPEAIPGDMLALQEFDLVVLDSVPAAEVSSAAQEALAAYVTASGGGLIMAGGQGSFAPGGWAQTPIEPILPVLLRTPDLVVAPQSATVLVIDNSGSMDRRVLGTGQSQQEIANEAAVLAVRSLEPTDLLGVVTFNSRPSLVLPLGPNGDPARTTRVLRAISADGGTNLGPALDLAREQLAGADQVKLKHVVVLTDGVSRDKQTLPDRVRELVADGVRVTAIAVGDGADVAELAGLAKLGGGEFFHAQNVAQLPRLLVRAVRVVRSPLVREEPVAVRVAITGPVTDGLDDAPDLGGLIVTRDRPDPSAAVLLRAATGEPLLATWPAGLGKVGAWTGDTGGWSRSWIESGHFRTFWPAFARDVARPASGGEIDADVEIAGGSLRVTARGPGPLHAMAYSPTGRARELPLSLIGPGEFAGSLPVDEPGTHVVVIGSGEDRRGTRPLVVGATLADQSEFRARTSDVGVLRALAASTGGRVLSLDGSHAWGLFDRAGLPARSDVRSLAPELLAALLGLVLLDVAVRRIAWDRWRAPTPEVSTARASGMTARLRASLDAGPAGDTALVLGEKEAQQLVVAARDRRRAARLGSPVGETHAAPPGPGEPAPDASAPTDATEAMRAAKARARRRNAED